MSPTTITVEAPGEPEVLRGAPFDPPEPGPGELLVRLAAIGVNFLDLQLRSGRYPRSYPYVPGGEGAGVVEAVGPGVDAGRIGERVAFTDIYGSSSGAYATHASVDSDSAVRVPDGLELEQAAAILFQGITALVLVDRAGSLESGQSCLVNAAAGGVGQLLVRLAKLRGASVIAVTSTPERAELATAAGADLALTYDAADFDAEVKGASDGLGVDVAYDSVGRDTFEQSLGSLRPLGLLVLYGASSGPVPPIDPSRLKAQGSVFATQVNSGDYVSTPERYRDVAGQVLALAAGSEIEIPIAGRYPLLDAPRAHEDLASRRVSGKLLLIPEEE